VASFLAWFRFQPKRWKTLRTSKRADVPAAGSAKSYGFAVAGWCTAAVILGGVGAYLYFGANAENLGAQVGSVQLAGSESMRPSVTACAEDFMTRNPQADVIVRGGGSGDGVAALLHGITDIAMASRELTPREREYARSNSIELAVFSVAQDGISIVVNRANPVADLSLSQLRDIFAGRVRNWGDLGTAPGEILPFARAAGSGTALMFGERILGEEPYAASVQRLPTNEAIVSEVASQRESIGYTDLGALKHGGDRVKAVALRADEQSSPAVAAPDTIVSGHYPLSRRLTLVTAGSPLGTAKAFIDFCSSVTGQALFQRAGFVAVKP
jgi:phosphate transport system substrate-binding protein